MKLTRWKICFSTVRILERATFLELAVNWKNMYQFCSSLASSSHRFVRSSSFIRTNVASQPWCQQSFGKHSSHGIARHLEAMVGPPRPPFTTWRANFSARWSSPTIFWKSETFTSRFSKPQSHQSSKTCCRPLRSLCIVASSHVLPGSVFETNAAKGITRWAREIHVEGENHERKSRGAWSFCILENQRLETGSFEQKGWWRPNRSTTPQGQQFVIISQWSDTGVCGAFATRSGCHGDIFNTPAWVQNKDNGKEAGQQRASLILGLFFKVFCAKLCKAAVACGFWWFFKVCRVPHSWRVRRVTHVETIHFNDESHSGD